MARAPALGDPSGLPGSGRREVPCGTRPFQSTSRGSVDVRSKHDLVAADSGESAANGWSLRDLLGTNASHGHDLEHEDHAMMLGWELAPTSASFGRAPGASTPGCRAGRLP
jgi:hypothetical protein